MINAMKHCFLWYALASAVTAIPQRPTPLARQASGGQQVAWASYILPTNKTAWNALTGYDTNKLSVLIANVNNGPDINVDGDWTDVINNAAATNKTVIGYVRTGYLSFGGHDFRTRLGSSDLADWMAQIEEDVDLWYKLYPKIGGIFFDEAWSQCGENNNYSELYRQISDNTKRKYSRAFTVLNPGSPMPQCFENSADTLLTFEGSYSSYTAGNHSNGWEATDTRKIWHIIYGVTKEQINEVAALSRQYGAGYIETTNDSGDNPYDTVPDADYMTTFLNAVSGGSVLTGPAGPRPNGTATSGPASLTVTGIDYTSANLSWPRVDGAAEIRIQINSSTDYVSLTGTTTRVTIGNLQPGTSYTFTLVVFGSDGNPLPGTPSAPGTTLSLPGGSKTVANVTSIVTANSTTYDADIAYPYSSIRLFIWEGDLNCDLTTDQAWPIEYNTGIYACNHYMVEGTTLYKYSGTFDKTTNTSTWMWTNLGGVTEGHTGHMYHWTIPLGSSNSTDTSQILIQVQGYGPPGTYFKPCPDGANAALCAA